MMISHLFKRNVEYSTALNRIIRYMTGIIVLSMLVFNTSTLVPTYANTPSNSNSNQSILDDSIPIEKKLEILRARLRAAQEKLKTKSNTTTPNSEPEPITEITETEDYVDPDELSEEELYQKLFGISKPKEVEIDMEVTVLVDSIYRGNTVLNTNTITSFFKYDKDDFLKFIKPFITSKAYKRIKKKLSSVDQVDDKWLIANKFPYMLKASSGTLEITTPENLRGIQIVDFSRDIFLVNQSSSSGLKPAFFSAYSNIQYERNNTNFVLQNQSVSATRLLLDSHVALGNIFIDTNYKIGEGSSYFDYLELNSFFFTKKYFARIGFLQEKPIFGINLNTTFSNALTSQFKKTKTFSFETDKNVKLSIFVNDELSNTKDVIPGKYRVRNFPQGSGLNKINVELEETKVSGLIDQLKRNESLLNKRVFYKFKQFQIESDRLTSSNRVLTLKNNKSEITTLTYQLDTEEIRLDKKLILNPEEDLLMQEKEIVDAFSFYNYKSENLLQPLEHRYKIIAGAYDFRSLNTRHFSKRVNLDNKIFLLENHLGLFSLTRLFSNITAITKYSYAPYLQSLEYAFSTGTVLGIITSSFNQSKVSGSRYIGKQAKLSIPIPVDDYFDSFQKWTISMSKENKYFRSFGYAISPIEDNVSMLGSTTIANILQFKKLGILNFPFVLSQTFKVNEQNEYAFNTTFMTAYAYKESMMFNIGLAHDFGELSTFKGLSLNLSFTYQRNAVQYPGNFNLNYNSQSHILLYNSVIQLATLDTTGVSLSFDSNKADLNLSNSSRGFKNKLTYSTSTTGDSISLGTSLSNARTNSSFGYSKKFSGQFDSSNAFKIKTTFYAVGKQFAIGPTSEQKSFAILRKHPLLKETPIMVNDIYPIDSFGPLGLGILTPLKESSLTLSFDSLPSSIDITDVNINILPEYGRGYYSDIGKKSTLFIYGKLVDQDNEPITLMYLEIKGLEDEKVDLIFTNSRGGFEYRVEKQQPYEIKVVDYNAEPYILKLTDDEFNAGGYLKIPTIQLTRKLN